MKNIICKKYSSIEELNFDNDKTIFFDTIYDKTLYNYIDNFSEEQNIMEQSEFLIFKEKYLKILIFHKKKQVKKQMLLLIKNVKLQKEIMHY